MTGKTADRPGLKALLAFLRKHRSHTCIVIIDDISRLARLVKTHHEIKDAITEAGGRLESPSIEFGTSSEQQFIENIHAALAEQAGSKNREQVIKRQTGRLLNGYWVAAKPPKGLRYENVPGHNKLMVRTEPVASVVQEALEGFASGRFQIQTEVLRFLESNPDYPQPKNGELKIDVVTKMLRNVIYAGYIEYPKRGVSLRKGQHEGLISMETFNLIQQRLDGSAKTPARADLDEDFPLRNFISCAHCGSTMGGGWSRGRSKEYAYYWCRGEE